ncbi:MAG: ABC transporter ATP-binding protein [Acidobacteria bacterium RIFCSPLOWO2_12_FULL_54_10]|nr:MAG: ABC transporter ATP-binding protein [Acidobacteria bacterium RIFCSPLOWO2_12_FULL_54_10]
MPLLEVDNLQKKYGDFVAVKGLSFSVEKEEIFGFLGPNGAGKTTTILMLATLLKPSGGGARISGHDVVLEPGRVRSVVGYVSQEIAVDEFLTARENLWLHGKLNHVSSKELIHRIDEASHMVGLDGRLDDLVGTYSGGMRKRLDLAEGLLHRPQLIFLDEPTLGLDIQTRRRIWDYIRKLRDEGLTVFLTTHYMEEADQLCDRVAIIDQGELKVLDAPQNLKAEMGGDVITVGLSDPSETVTRRAQEVFSRLEWISRTELHLQGVILISRNSDATLPRLMQIAAENDLEIISITLKHPSLDDVFLAHTGHDLRQEDGGADAFRRLKRGVRQARR